MLRVYLQQHERRHVEATSRDIHYAQRALRRFAYYLDPIMLVLRQSHQQTLPAPQDLSRLVHFLRTAPGHLQA